MTTQPEAPKHVRANPRLSTWVRVDGDGTVHVQCGKVELGQGILTALTQIAADELAADPTRVLVHGATTAGGPDEGPTAGSMSVADSGEAVRAACAHARWLFAAAAARRFGVRPADVDARDGGFGPRDADGWATYADLAPDVDLEVDIDVSVPTTKAGDAAVTGKSMPRVDLPDKVRGRARFIQDIVLPGQLWGQVVRPPSPAAVLVDWRPRRSRRCPVSSLSSAMGRSSVWSPTTSTGRTQPPRPCAVRRPGRRPSRCPTTVT